MKQQESLKKSAINAMFANLLSVLASASKGYCKWCYCIYSDSTNHGQIGKDIQCQSKRRLKRLLIQKCVKEGKSREQCITEVYASSETVNTFLVNLKDKY
eukprot:scaffold10026_cov310-Alexandrium_tamarense.AAC.1